MSADPRSQVHLKSRYCPQSQEQRTMCPTATGCEEHTMLSHTVLRMGSSIEMPDIPRRSEAKIKLHALCHVSRSSPPWLRLVLAVNTCSGHGLGCVTMTKAEAAPGSLGDIRLMCRRHSWARCLLFWDWRRKWLRSANCVFRGSQATM